MTISLFAKENGRKFFIFCDGGLANRINSLLSGIVLAENLILDPVVLWPRNNRCGAAFSDIFSSEMQVFETRLHDVVEHQNKLHIWLHENDYGFSEPTLSLRTLDGINALQALAGEDNRSILFSENAVPVWLDEQAVSRAIRSLRMQGSITERAKNILNRKGDASYFGVHLRGTDFLTPPPVDEMMHIVSANPQHRFFVCSDELEIEQRFAVFSNVFTHDKTSYVEKRTDGAWRSDVLDSDSLPYTSNIDRVKESVVDAAVDLLLLSASVPIQTSSSSFLSLSKLLNSSDFVDRHLKTREQFPALPRVYEGETIVAKNTAIQKREHAMNGPYMSQGEVIELLNLVRPLHLVSDFKVRIGSESDGGYVLPSQAKNCSLLFSIGIGDQVSFDLDLAERGAKVLQFDHTIPGPPALHPRIEFRRQGWGPRDTGELISLKTMISLSDWVDPRHPILKFDTEGAEWDALDAASIADLELFEIITGEFHGFHNLMHRNFYSCAWRVLEKLATNHHPIHLHANNATGVVLVLGVPIPPLLEITYLRKRSGIFGGHSTEPIPGPLDRPNMADRPDLCLRPF